MIKELLRIIGATCILSGSILYFSSTNGDEHELQAENHLLKNEVASLETLLKQTEGELAKLQTLTSTAQQSEEKIKPKNKEPKEENDAIVKTILHIEHGTSSKDVANELATISIIKDADSLNEYLTSKDLAKKIQIGEYPLDSSMSIEAIAKIITHTN